VDQIIIGGEEEAAAAAITQAGQPFDLSNDLMIRATVIRYKAARGTPTTFGHGRHGSGGSIHIPSNNSRSTTPQTLIVSPLPPQRGIHPSLSSNSGVMENRELLLIVAHHSAFDGASIGSLLNEFTIMWNHFIHTPMPPASPSGKTTNQY
jgi:hypothetical protein